MKAPKLNLSEDERKSLRRNKIRISQITEMSQEALERILQTGKHRARELKALADFQSIPSIGPEFARDLISLGYYSLEQLKEKNGAELMMDLEKKLGYQVDPCVEDQFRLVVHYANNPGSCKRWWDFTEDRKHHRKTSGYPSDKFRKEK